jgi:Skp family chaperone for outer membrane proteins
MPLGEKEQHESYGMIEINRSTTNRGQSLFGSSIRHENIITIKIKKGVVERSLNNDWYFDKGTPFIEVDMSPTQFAELITTLNHGCGIPCTIKYINGQKMAECPEVNKRQQFEQEFARDMYELKKSITDLTKETKQLLNSKKALTIKEKQLILAQIESLEREILHNVPYVQSQFNEQMDKTVLEAKGEIEAFVTNTVQKLGLNSLQQLKAIYHNVPAIEESSD